jgi:hypothetical protein
MGQCLAYKNSPCSYVAKKTASIIRVAKVPKTKYQIPALAAVFPPFISAGQRHDILEAHALQSLRGQGGASATTAVADNRLVFVCCNSIDLVFELASRQRLRSSDSALRHLVGLAHVNQREVLLRLLHAAEFSGVNLFDLALRFVHQLLVFRQRHMKEALPRAKKEIVNEGIGLRRSVPSESRPKKELQMSTADAKKTPRRIEALGGPPAVRRTT